MLLSNKTHVKYIYVRVRGWSYHIYLFTWSVGLFVMVDQHRRAGHGRGSGSSTTSSGIQWKDGALVGAESLWPSVIRWKPMFSSNWKNIKNHRGRGGDQRLFEKKSFF